MKREREREMKRERERDIPLFEPSPHIGDYRGS